MYDRDEYFNTIVEIYWIYLIILIRLYNNNLNEYYLDEHKNKIYYTTKTHNLNKKTDIYNLFFLYLNITINKNNYIL